MSIIEVFQANPGLFILFAGILGLLVGSFLNVVIHRLPLMMAREWRAQCAELLATPGQAAEAPLEHFTLSTPRSRCPHCNHAITALENVPVISYVLLRGKCSACGIGISRRYPAVELLTALLSALVAWKFGVGWAAGAGLLLTWVLLALSFIDFDTQLLPDSITLPVLWGGLALSLFALGAGFPTSRDAIIGALAGYLSLWTVYRLFKLATGREGMGYGDFKLLAMLGAWLGWQALPMIVLLSSLCGALLGISLMLVRGRDRNLPIPFGPYLAMAGWIAMLWGADISRVYWQFMSVS